MHGIKELKRQHDAAKNAVIEAKKKEAERRIALVEAVIAAGESELASRGIVPGVKVSFGGNTGIYVGCKAWDYAPSQSRASVMVEKKDGSAHGRAEARGFWGAQISEIEIFKSAGDK